jgi:hypothetical protein
VRSCKRSCDFCVRLIPLNSHTLISSPIDQVIAAVSVSPDTRPLHCCRNTICALIALLQILHLVSDFDIVLRARFIKAFEEDASFADVLARKVSADFALAHDLFIRFARCRRFLSFLACRERHLLRFVHVLGSDFDLEILIKRCIVLRELVLHVRHVGADSPAICGAAAAFFFFGEGDGAGACAAAAFVAAGYEAGHVFAATHDVKDGAGADAFEVLD